MVHGATISEISLEFLRTHTRAHTQDALDCAVDRLAFEDVAVL